MERQLPAIKGCFHSAFSSGGGAKAARTDMGLATLAGRPVVLLICKPRKSDPVRSGPV